MRNRFIILSCAVVAMLVFTGGLPAQTAPQPGATTTRATPRTPDGKPNLAGMWNVTPFNAGGGRGDFGAPNDPTTVTALGGAKDAYTVIGRFGFLPVEPDGKEQEPPLQPWALAKYRFLRSKAPTNRNLADRGPEELDPAMRCIPEGFPRVYTLIHRFEILPPLADRIIMIFSNKNDARQIYMDGRKYTGIPSFIGHAVGRWDGDTLVVDTVALRGGNEVWLDYWGTPYTDALHVVERIRRPSHDILEIDFTFEDPRAFTRPWEGKKRFYLLPAGSEWEEYTVCETPKALGGVGAYSF